MTLRSELKTAADGCRYWWGAQYYCGRELKHRTISTLLEGLVVEILAPMVREIDRSHNIIIMDSKSNIQTLEKVQTASAQIRKIFEEPNKFARKSETASRKFNLAYYASWLPLSWYHYPISQIVSAKSEVTFKEPQKRVELKNNLPQSTQSMAAVIFASFALFAVRFTISLNELSSIAQPPAFIGVHPRLIYRTAPAEGR